MKTNKFVLILITIAAVLYNAGISYAQENPAIDDIKQQIEAMDKAMFYQKEQMQALKDKLEAETGEKIKSAFDESMYVKEDMDHIDQIVDERIEKYLTDKDNRAKLVKAGIIPGLSAYWDEGMKLKSEDGNFKLQIGGSVFNDWGWFDQDDDIETFIGDQVDGTEFRKARIFMKGDIYKNIEYMVEYDFASAGRPGFKNVYLELKKIPYVRHFRAGHFKEPFSLEELTSNNFITFMERGLNNVFAPSRNTGFMLYNHALDKRMTWAAGVFRNADDFGDSEGDETTEGGYSFSGRITGLPLNRDDGRKLVHAGFSYSFQNAFEDELQFKQKPEMHMADSFVDTGKLPGEHLNLFNPELALVCGPFSIQSEYTFASLDLDDAPGSDPDYTGWYVFGSYFLTGEHRRYNEKAGSFERIRPFSNLDWEGGLGAIELAARYSELDLNDEEIKGGRLNDVTLGCNWYLNPNTRVMFNYVHADADTADFEDGNADLFATRFQIDF